MVGLCDSGSADKAMVEEGVVEMVRRGGARRPGCAQGQDFGEKKGGSKNLKFWEPAFLAVCKSKICDLQF
jgi:hypothetical protein